MRPKQPQKARHEDLFRARLDQSINMKHALVALADKIDWAWLDEQLAVRFSDKGPPAEPVRFMIGMFLLKHTYGLSDEQVPTALGARSPISSTSPARNFSNTSCPMSAPA